MIDLTKLSKTKLQVTIQDCEQAQQTLPKITYRKNLLTNKVQRLYRSDISQQRTSWATSIKVNMHKKNSNLRHAPCHNIDVIVYVDITTKMTKLLSKPHVLRIILDHAKQTLPSLSTTKHVFYSQYIPSTIEYQKFVKALLMLFM